MPSAIEKVLALQKQLDSEKGAAIQELLEARGKLDDQLKALGYSSGQRSSGVKRQRDPNKPCPVCGEKGHDARKHRGEKKTKAKK